MKTWTLAALALLAFLLGLYCFAGYAMNASFSVAAGGQRNAHAAVIWGVVGLGSVAVGLMFTLAAWKRSKNSR